MTRASRAPVDGAAGAARPVALVNAPAEKRAFLQPHLTVAPHCRAERPRPAATLPSRYYSPLPPFKNNAPTDPELSPASLLAGSRPRSTSQYACGVTGSRSLDPAAVRSAAGFCDKAAKSEQAGSLRGSLPRADCLGRPQSFASCGLRPPPPENLRKWSLQDGALPVQGLFVCKEPILQCSLSQIVACREIRETH
jgi:hypothetical protein